MPFKTFLFQTILHSQIDLQKYKCTKKIVSPHYPLNKNFCFWKRSGIRALRACRWQRGVAFSESGRACQNPPWRTSPDVEQRAKGVSTCTWELVGCSFIPKTQDARHKTPKDIPLLLPPGHLVLTLCLISPVYSPPPPPSSPPRSLRQVARGGEGWGGDLNRAVAYARLLPGLAFAFPKEAYVNLRQFTCGIALYEILAEHLLAAPH